jgi:triphosphatase
MRELELKYLIDDADIRRLRAWLRAEMNGAVLKPRQLRSIYFDTDGQLLRENGIALRVRRDGRRWLQTVKAGDGAHSGVQSLTEIETPAPGGRIDLGTIEGALGERLREMVNGSELIAVSETSIRRNAATLTTSEGCKIELALDIGEIRANGAAAPFSELEIELIEGNAAGLFDFARRLLSDIPLRPSRLAKSARAQVLAAEGRLSPTPRHRGAATVALAPGQSSELAARDVLRECLAQISENLDFVLVSDAVEGPHQLRIGLRRLRSAFDAFQPVIGTAQLGALDDEARWLSHEVGRLRDLDVALSDILLPEAETHPDLDGLRPVIALNEKRRDAAKTHLCEVLRSARARLFLLDLTAFIECRGWLVVEDFDQTTRLARAVEELASEALEDSFDRVRKKARGIATLETEERHSLRKALKRLRYTAEFFSPLHEGKKSAAFLKRLRKLQDLFGDLNDLAMLEHLMTGPDAPGGDDPAIRFASGWLVGNRGARAELHWHEAKLRWQDLKSAPVFWR